MQKMLASVPECEAKSFKEPAAAPVTVMVLTPPPAGPNAPLSLCSQVSNVPLHAAPTAMPFCQHGAAGLAKAAVLSKSRQNPQNTRVCAGSVLPVSLVAK